ncbi:MAG: DUF4363 family protein [Oscillibacter sp.]
MKWKAYVPPVLVLLVLLLLCLWNSRAITAQTAELTQQLRQVDTLARADCWPAARRQLERGYADWSAQQTYLHIVIAHDAVDRAEALYRRAAAFAETENFPELTAELAELENALGLLAEMERFTLKNTL